VAVVVAEETTLVMVRLAVVEAEAWLLDGLLLLQRAPLAQVVQVVQEVVLILAERAVIQFMEL
jgi:hypothetical protein